MATPAASPTAGAAAPPPGATQVATAAAKGGAPAMSVGWIHPANADEAKTLSIVAPYRSLGVACASGLPPSSRVQLRLGGDAGPPATAEGTAGPDGRLEVRFGIQRAAGLSVEFVSITPPSGPAPSALPAGASATVTLPASKACDGPAGPGAGAQGAGPGY